MLECLILGDSIAKGISQFRPECHAITKIGINSRTFANSYFGKFDARTVVISLGTNDSGINTLDNLTMLRANIHAERVIWVLPKAIFSKAAKHAVNKIAETHGDTIIKINDISTDGIHPTSNGYRELANKTK